MSGGLKLAAESINRAIRRGIRRFSDSAEAFRCLHFAIAHQAGTPFPSIGIFRSRISASRRLRLSLSACIVDRTGIHSILTVRFRRRGI